MKAVVPHDALVAPYHYERERLARAGIDLEVCGTSRSELIAAARDAEVLFGLGQPLPRDVLIRLPRLLLVAYYGIGVDSIDVAAASELGIVVANTPLFGPQEVADHALTLLLACSRRLLQADRLVRAGDWDWRPLRPLHSLGRSTVGLIGFGHIGQEMARRLLALGCRVLYSDPLVPAPPFHGPEPAPLEALLRQADFVSIHVPLTASTRGLLGESELRTMKPAAFLVNTARGSVVDEVALVAALREGRLAGAGLDVFADEPLPRDHPLLGLDNVVLTPHIGGYTEEAWQRVRETVCDAVEAIQRHEWPLFVVNPDVTPRLSLRRAPRADE